MACIKIIPRKVLCTEEMLIAFVQIFLKAALGLKVEYGKGIELGNMVRAAFL